VFLQNQCEDYSCTFLSAGDDPRLPVLGGLHKSSKFAKKIIKFFKERIDDQYPLLTEHVDLMLSQHLAHEVNASLPASHAYYSLTKILRTQYSSS
jgi:hypothetical protein